MTPATRHCFHCSEVLPRDNPQHFAAVFGNETLYFCCPACLAVADAIHNLGLSQYYRQRDSKPQQPPPIPTDIVAGIAPQITRDGLVEVQLFIPGIHCTSCCWLIEHRLQQLDGVMEAHAQFHSHKLTVRWRNEKKTDAMSPEKILQTLQEIGYRAAPWQPSQQQQTINSRQKKLLQRLGVAGLLTMQIHMVAMGSYFGAMPNMQQWMNAVALLLSLPVWFYSADIFFISAWKNLCNLMHGSRNGFVASMDLPVAIAIVAAATASIIAVIKGTDDVYFDSVAMFVFLLLGARFLEARARNRLAVFSQEPVLPQTCIRLKDGNADHREHSNRQHINIGDLQKNDCVLIETGTIAVDGRVLAGAAAVEQAAMTGEFLPVQKQAGDTVIAGTTLLNGELVVQAEHWGSDSRIADLHRRMEHALAGKQQRHALHTTRDTVAQYFTPLVLLLAVGSALYWLHADPVKALPSFLAVLVASCPCALTLAIPAALTAATLQLRRNGILISSSHVLEMLPGISQYVFDKTGTLTQGRMHITNVQVCGRMMQKECLAIASAMEQHATHPVASAFRITAENRDLFAAHDVKTVLHCGIEAVKNGSTWRLGKAGWACHEKTDEQYNTNRQHDADDNSMHLFLTQNGETQAIFTLGDPLRNDAKYCVQALQQHNITCAIASGDHSGAVDDVARQLAISHVHKHCSPEQKVAVIDNMRKKNGAVLMVGDGINDGPVLAHADISVALADASQTAQLAADVILLDNTLQDLLALHHMSLKTRRIARQNLAWALLYNVSILPLAAAGWLTPVSAAIGMALSSLLVTGNALRLFASNRKTETLMTEKT